MPHEAEGLRVYAFDSLDNPLVKLITGESQSPNYIHSYLADLQAKSVVEEVQYFDRDYLAAFSAFYSTSSAGYSNACRRLHFFAQEVSRKTLETALRFDPLRTGEEGAVDEDAAGQEGGGVDDEALKAAKGLQASYLGFVVLRPTKAPFGRTVLRWYEDDQPKTPRVTSPSREHVCHLAGLPLRVTGVAWQQQDVGIGGCATIAVWTCLSSSAFDEFHATPTTTEITRHAHAAPSIYRLFPSRGLDLPQTCEAIRAIGLAPIPIEGDQFDVENNHSYFTRARFAHTCAALLRSGYPVFVAGDIAGGLHACCIVGFRESSISEPKQGEADQADEGIRYLYLNDDGLGPSARFEIAEVEVDPGGPDDVTDQAGSSTEPGEENERKATPPKKVILRLSPPPPRNGSWKYPADPSRYGMLVPNNLVVAVPQELRLSPDTLYQEAEGRLRDLEQVHEGPLPGMVYGSRYVKLSEFLRLDVFKVLRKHPDLVAKVRLALAETVPPMCLHLAVVRFVSSAKEDTVLDILLDTSENDHTPVRAYASIAYQPSLLPLLEKLRELAKDDPGFDPGVIIKAF
ncbi:MAG: hypothetical protein JKY65_30875 [Planctomycetes bacterium]|nr:hypothetical protein [Planctomycetota bacterium]